MNHFVRRCMHGVVVSQCRCMSASKLVTIVPCPPRCDERVTTVSCDTEARVAHARAFAAGNPEAAKVWWITDLLATIDELTETLRRQEERDG